MEPSTAIQLIHKAIEAERDGRCNEARERLRQVVAQGDTPSTLDARLRLGLSLIYGGPAGYAEAEEVLLTARTQAEKASAPRQQARALHLLALLQWRQGQLDEAERLLNQSPVFQQVAAHGPEAGQHFHYRGLVEASRNQLTHAERLYFRALKAYRELGYQSGQAQVCESLGKLLLRQGKTAPALEFAQRSLELKRKIGDRYGQAITLSTLGRIYWQQARPDLARQHFDEYLQLAKGMDDQWDAGVVLRTLGEIALYEGQHQQALERFEEALQRDPGPEHVARARLGEARTHLAAGRRDEARAACTEAETAIARMSEPGGLPGLLAGVRGMIARRQGDEAEAERLLRKAREVLRLKEFVPETAPFLHELRDLYQGRGETARALVVTSEALDLFLAAGAEQAITEAEEWVRKTAPGELTRLVLERQLPGTVVDDILSGRLKRPEPTHQQVVVLFSDVRDYTQLSEGRGAREVVELLNEWFTEATRAIRQHGGVIDKFIGDAVMALFGVPEYSDEAAANAVRAALAMRDALMALNLRHEEFRRPTLHIGVGIHAGEAVLGYIGSYLHHGYTAIGDSVNTAARLESATKRYDGCDILISQTVEDIQQHFGVAETTLLEYAELHHKAERVPVYQVLGPRSPQGQVEQPQ
jgi:class 3 adenylate cyclase